MENDALVQNMLLELRRGILSLALLSQLGKEEYGYSLLKALSDKGMEIDQSTLYPLLRRLESQGLLQSDWRIVDEARPRRYYVILLSRNVFGGLWKNGFIDFCLYGGKIWNPNTSVHY